VSANADTSKIFLCVEKTVPTRKSVREKRSSERITDLSEWPSITRKVEVLWKVLRKNRRISDILGKKGVSNFEMVLAANFSCLGTVGPCSENSQNVVTWRILLFP